MNTAPPGDAAENAASASRGGHSAPHDFLVPIRDGLSLLALLLLLVFGLRAAVVANFECSRCGDTSAQPPLHGKCVRAGSCTRQ